MKDLPIVNLKEIEQQELQKRISLSNRPTLNFNTGQLDEVASRLASSNFDRERFVEDPRSYLQEQMLPVASAQLVEPTHVQTAEACTAFAVCNIVAVVGIFFGAFVQVVAAVQAYAGVQAVTACYNSTRGCLPVDNNHYVPPASFGFVGVL